MIAFAMHQPLPRKSLSSIWPVGHIREIRRDMLAYFTRCAQECGDIALMRFGPRNVFLLSHPDHIEQVLVARNRAYSKHYAFKFLRPLLGQGLLTAEGDHWLRQRRLMQPAFARDALAQYAAVMVDYAEEMVATWSDGEERDIEHEVTELTLRIAAKTLMDIDLGEQLSIVSHGTDAMTDDFRRRFQSIAQLPRWLPTPNNRRSDRDLKQLDGVIEGIIAARRKSSEDHGDLLSLLMQARDEDDGRGMSDKQLRDEVMTLLLAGHETTANALSWTWYLLAQHPRVETKLLAELDEVLGGRAPTMDDLPRLAYTEQIVKESMRLYPPAYTVGREAIEDTQIGNFKVPRGTTVFMSQWVVHHDNRWYDEPEKFAPERWTAEFERTRPKYAYFPFGGGPRVCIGNTFAMIEATLLVAAIAQRYRFRLASDEPVIPWAAVTLRPRHGIPMLLYKREEQAKSGGRQKSAAASSGSE